MRLLTLLLATGITTASLSACGDVSSAITAPQSGLHNGSIFGSGNAVQDSGPATPASAASDTSSSAVQRNGSIFGSGN